MIQASIYGRLGRDPQQRQTKNGADMVTASLAVDATPGNAEESETIWFQILAFGKVADTLAHHSKSDLVSLSGQITQSRWTGNDGEERVGMTIIANTVISAKSVRPTGGRKKAESDQKTECALAGGAAGDFNDDIPFRWAPTLCF